MRNEQLSKDILHKVNGTYDLNFWATGTIEPWLTSGDERPNVQKAVNKAVKKYKSRFKEAWEELSDK